jgi:large subunit ribosomal protein L3
MGGLLGKKIKMTQVFDESGEVHAVTVVAAGPCFVTQVKTSEVDGYNAIQLGFSELKEKHLKSAQAGLFKKLNIKPLKYLREFENFTDREVNPGDELRVDIFSEGEGVRIAGISKGYGFQGAMKRHGFSGANKTHGQSDRWRAPGSLGQSSWPSRVFKGIKMAGRMGTDRVTVPETKVIKIDPEKNLLFIKGPVPGSVNSLVEIQKL